MREQSMPGAFESGDWVSGPTTASCVHCRHHEGSDPCHTHLAAARRQMEQDAGEPKRRTAAFRPFFLEKGLKRLEFRLRSQT